MNESAMLKIALIVAIIGLAAITLITRFSGIQEINIGEAKGMGEGETVRITGVIQRVSVQEGFSIITLRKEEEISVVLFDSINLSKGQKIEVQGKTKDYNGAKELVADKIIVK